MSLIVESFVASTYVEKSRHHMNCHKESLKEYGLENLFLSSKDDWSNRNDTLVISIIDSETNQIIGGGRIIQCEENLEFPLFEMLHQKDEYVIRFLNQLTTKNSGEIIGVWKTKNSSEYNVNAKFILRCIFSTMKHYNLNYVFGLSSIAIWRSLNSLGSEPIDEFGKKGVLKYTEKEIPAKVYEFLHPNSIKKANQHDKEILNELTSNPNATIIEQTEKATFEVRYKLNL